MRILPLLPSCTLAIGLQAQVINGSFETAGAFDLTGWTWQCTTPEPVMPGAPGAGDYGVRKPFSNTQGCLFEHMTQYIASANWGDVFTLTGWVMQESGLFSATPGLYFAEDSLGVVVLKNGITTNATTWTWLQVTDTVYPGALSSPLVLLHTGLVGGPAFGWSRFDGIGLQELVTAIADIGPLQFPHHYDAGTEQLFVHVGNTALIRVDLFDLTGRDLAARQRRAGPTVILDLPTVPTGVYLARVTTDLGEGVLRFVKQ